MAFFFKGRRGSVYNILDIHTHIFLFFFYCEGSVQLHKNKKKNLILSFVVVCCAVSLSVKQCGSGSACN